MPRESSISSRPPRIATGSRSFGAGWCSTPHRRKWTPSRKLLTDHVRERSFVLVANIFKKLCVERDAQIARRRPRAGVSLGVVDGELNFEPSKVRPTDSLGDPALRGERIALQVEPQTVLESGGLHDQRVALPAARR